MSLFSRPHLAAVAGTVAFSGLVVASAVAVPALAEADSAVEPPRHAATMQQQVGSPNMHQGIGVDGKYVYAVANREIMKLDKATGKPLLQYKGDPNGPFEHFDSGVVHNGKLYTSHSNYSEWPMESSIEVFDTKTLNHIDSHSLGIYRGSLTWLDRYDGAWWAGFANYDRENDKTGQPYGHTYNTQVVKMDDDFQVVESWVIPKAILDKLSPMSNSGGSWGPDGRLYLSGHDLPEVYAMELPEAGAELHWVATVDLPGIEGQGIAWDRTSKSPVLWGMSRKEKSGKAFQMPVAKIEDRPQLLGEVVDLTN